MKTRRTHKNRARTKPSKISRTKPGRMKLSRKAMETGYLTKEDIEDREIRVGINRVLAQSYTQLTQLANSAMMDGHRLVLEHHARMQGKRPPSEKELTEARVTDTDIYGFNRRGGLYAAIGDGMERDDAKLEVDRNESRFLYWWNPHAKGIVETIVGYVCGHALKVTFKHPDNEAKAKEWTDHWKKISTRKDTKFETRAQELVRRALQDGETLSHVFVTKAREDVSANAKQPERRAKWRFGEPEDLKNPESKLTDKNVKLGIETSPDDPEDVVNYYFGDKPIEADEIIHTKIGSRLNARRGVPFLLTVAHRLRQYDSWLTYRLLLNQARAAIACVIYRDSATGGKDNLLSQVKTGTRTRETGSGRSREESKYYFDAATTLILRKGQELKFEAPNINAPDVKDDGRAILLSIASGVCLPEYMVTADTQNGNYASQQVAEARGIVTLLSLQGFFLREIAGIVKRLIVLELQNGEEDETSEAMIVTVTGPKIVIRDELVNARAMEIKHRNRVIDIEYWRRSDAIDTEEIDFEAEQTEPDIFNQRPDPEDGAGDPTRAPSRGKPAKDKPKSPGNKKAAAAA